MKSTSKTCPLAAILSDCCQAMQPCLQTRARDAWAGSKCNLRPAPVAWAGSKRSARPAPVAWASSNPKDCDQPKERLQCCQSPHDFCCKQPSPAAIRQIQLHSLNWQDTLMQSIQYVEQWFNTPKTVLIIDCIEDLCIQLSQIFSAGFSFYRAFSFTDTVNLMKKINRPELVIYNRTCCFPEKAITWEQLRQDNLLDCIPLICIAANDQDELHALDMGAISCFRQPLSFTLLAAAIRSIFFLFEKFIDQYHKDFTRFRKKSFYPA